MTALGQHIRIRLWDDRVIAPTPRERRIVARAVLRIAEDLPLLAFGLADTHFHAESLGDEALANEIARRIGTSLRRRLGLSIGFRTLPLRPIQDLWHLGNCFRYVHTQAAHHGIGWEGWYEATSLPDLLGLRPRGGFLSKRTREHLPRLGAKELLSWHGVAELRPVRGRPEEVLEATLASAALERLSGRTPEVLALRRAAMEVLDGAGTRAELAALLGVSVRSVSRLREAAPDPVLVRAIGLNLGLRRALGQLGMEPPGVASIRKHDSSVSVGGDSCERRPAPLSPPIGSRSGGR